MPRVVVRVGRMHLLSDPRVGSHKCREEWVRSGLECADRDKDQCTGVPITEPWSGQVQRGSA
jgi:hypothetical protein